MDTTSDKTAYYRKVSASEVDPAKVREAEAALALAERRLGLPKISVIWCRPIDELSYGIALDIDKLAKLYRGSALPLTTSDVFADEDNGFAAKVHPAGRGGATIYINSETKRPISFLVGHECKHLADWKTDLYRGLYEDPEVRRRLEERANAFGEEVERELNV